jgi:hypothetical protein
VIVVADLLTSERARTRGRRQGDAFGASLAGLDERAAMGRIQSLKAVLLAGKDRLRADGVSPEEAQAWAEGYLAGFDPHAQVWFAARGT